MNLEVQIYQQDEVMVHGFNGTSRLWRLPAAAIRRGSVFRVKGDGIEVLAKAAAAGRWLGERTHEGFGRFRVDAELPGSTPTTPTSAGGDLREAAARDVDEDVIARETHGWLSQCRVLAKHPNSGSRRPSLSQWEQLVVDLETQGGKALSSRKNPMTAGAAGWKDPAAKTLLTKLENVPSEQRASYARLFVRWLRVEMRAEARRGVP